MTNKTSKHAEHADERKIKIISLISLLYGFSLALLVYIESSYFKKSLGTENVSIFYFLAYAVALAFLLNMHRVIKRIGETTAFFLFFFIQLCAIIFLGLINPSALGVFLLMVYIVASFLVLVVLDIILENYSEDKKSGRIRGMHLMVMNLGFLFGPLLSTQILERFDYSGLFLVSMVLNMLIFTIGLMGLRGSNKKFVGNLTVRDMAKKILVNKDLMKIYWISFALEFFYALMTIYATLYLLDRGLSWEQIGIIFSIMLVPFVIFGYIPGLLADKFFGEKEMIIGSLLLMSLATGSIFFITSNSVFIWASILFATRVGAAFIDTLRDSYFYKKIDGRDMDLISFFRTGRSVAYLAATALSAMILIFLPVKAVFLFLSLALLVALYPAFKLVDNKSEFEMVKK